MSEKQRKILVTSALPYVNGSPHMGHLVEYIQTDIWGRFQKLRGHDCIYVCASDSHGTPIMLKARELGITPEELTAGYSKEFIDDFRDFNIEFDNFHTTHSPENEMLTCRMFEALRDADYIYTKTIEQAFDEQEKMFLPDRFVKGTCPRCKTEDQYGDACENCGATYSPGASLDVSQVYPGDGKMMIQAMSEPDKAAELLEAALYPVLRAIPPKTPETFLRAARESIRTAITSSGALARTSCVNPGASSSSRQRETTEAMTTTACSRNRSPRPTRASNGSTTPRRSAADTPCRTNVYSAFSRALRTGSRL